MTSDCRNAAQRTRGSSASTRALTSSTPPALSHARARSLLAWASPITWYPLIGPQSTCPVDGVCVSLWHRRSSRRLSCCCSMSRRTTSTSRRVCGSRNISQTTPSACSSSPTPRCACARHGALGTARSASEGDTSAFGYKGIWACEGMLGLCLRAHLGVRPWSARKAHVWLWLCAPAGPPAPNTTPPPTTIHAPNTTHVPNTTPCP